MTVTSTVHQADDVWYAGLSWPDRRKVQAVQLELIDSGFGADSEQVTLACWIEAVKRCRDGGMTVSQGHGTVERVSGQPPTTHGKKKPAAKPRDEVKIRRPVLKASSPPALPPTPSIPRPPIVLDDELAHLFD